jgi:hypothetical protein
MELETGATDDGEVSIIILEVMPVRSRITHPALDKDVMIREILQNKRPLEVNSCF